MCNTTSNWREFTYRLIPTYRHMDIYGTKCVGRIVTKSMSYFLHLCYCYLPYCATLEAWNWFVAGQYLNASHPRSPVWPNQNVTLFSGNFFGKTSSGYYVSTIRDFDLIPKLRATSEYQLSSGTIYTMWLASTLSADCPAEQGRNVMRVTYFCGSQ